MKKVIVIGGGAAGMMAAITAAKNGCQVDLFEQKTSETTCTARKRTWSVIPDTEGDGTDALIYKGSFKAAGEITKGTATTTDGWKTCTFTAGGE